MEDFLELLKDPDSVSAIRAIIEQYKPQIYSILGELVNIWKDFQNSDYYSLAAAGSKKMFDAYVEIGFTEDQAMMLLLNKNLELMDYTKKISVRNKKD